MSHMRIERWPAGSGRPDPVARTQLTLKETMRRYREAKEQQDTEKRWDWLVHRRDANMNRPEDVEYDPRTLYVPEGALRTTTAFVRQFWEIKANNYDLVLFVRVGSFYELYDTDADVGLRIGLKPMGAVQKANMWKVGCRASSFAWWCSKVLALGYSVGRVEEMPVGGDHSGILERQLVQMYTPGTSVLTCWDMDSGQEENGQPVIFSVCEWRGAIGGCFLNLSDASFTISEWQEVDEQRSILRKILDDGNPVEIICPCWSCVSAETRQVLGAFKPLVSSGIESPISITHLRLEDASKILDILRGTSVSGDCMSAITEMLHRFGGECSKLRESLDMFVDDEVALVAFLSCLNHLKYTGSIRGVLQRASLGTMSHFSPSSLSGSMLLDATALKTLEILHGSLGTTEGSLHHFLSAKANSAMGRRCIWRWLGSPSTSITEIEARLDVVDGFKKVQSGELEESLSKLPDVEKMMPMIAQQLSLLNLDDEKESLLMLSGCRTRGGEGKERVIVWGQIKSMCRAVHGILYFSNEYISFMESLEEQGPTVQRLPILQKVMQGALLCRNVCTPIASSLPLPSTELKDSDPVILPEGIWESIDQLSFAVKQAQAAVEHRSHELIASISQSVVHGSVQILKKVRITGADGEIAVECPKSLESHLFSVLNWQPYSRTRTGFLYRDETLTLLSCQAAEAQRAYNLGSHQAVSVLANLFIDEYSSLLKFCQEIGEVDALLSFARVTDDSGPDSLFKRPRFGKTTAAGVMPCIFFQDAWNPQLLQSNHLDGVNQRPMVKNTIRMGGQAPGTILISGANSGGKTTFLKTVCICTIMSQVGSYAPCTDSLLDPVSRIKTRLGARDRIAAGESTFAIEMTETAAILNQSDRYSLAIIDELGRGTSPTEGEAIAYGTLQNLSSRCRVVFATHYHGLNRHFANDPRIARYHMPVIGLGHQMSQAEKYRLQQGPAPENDSGGIACAQSAGIPKEVTQRALFISKSIKAQILDDHHGPLPHLLRLVVEHWHSLTTVEKPKILHAIAVLQESIFSSLKNNRF